MPVQPNSLLQHITPCIHTHIRFCLKMGIFYLQFGLPSTRIQWKQSPKTHLFKNTLQSRVFENAGFSFTCGQTKMEVFKYVDVIHHILLAWRMLRKGCSRISIVSAFSVVWTGENDLNMLRVDAYFLKREDILMHVDGAIIDVLIIARYSKIWYPKIPLFFHNTNSPCLP